MPANSSSASDFPGERVEITVEYKLTIEGDSSKGKARRNLGAKKQGFDIEGEGGEKGQGGCDWLAAAQQAQAAARNGEQRQQRRNPFPKPGTMPRPVDQHGRCHIAPPATEIARTCPRFTPAERSGSLSVYGRFAPLVSAVVPVLRPALTFDADRLRIVY
jgi:hypothetical protein